MSRILIPRELEADGEGNPARRRWLDTLPEVVDLLASEWELALGEPYQGATAAWIAPVQGRDGEELVLKVGWRHMEAEHEADALRLWAGNGAVRCLDSRAFDDTLALLLERCTPGDQLRRKLDEPDQDLVIADLLSRLWESEPPYGDRFRPLTVMCSHWADETEAKLASAGRGLDPGLVRAGVSLLRELPASPRRRVLLSTDLHAGNVLSARREPWLAVDPKPFVGDPAFDVVQHMLNCGRRLARDPRALAARMAELLSLDHERVCLWLFARCAQEGIHDAAMREPARALAP